MTTLNTLNMVNDVYSFFNHIKDAMCYSKKNNVTIMIKNVVTSSSFCDYENNMYSFTHDQIITIAWEMAKATARAYND